MTARSRIVMEPGWEDDLDAEVAAGMAAAFDDRLGPAIADDARTIVPIDTSRLHNSLNHEIDDTGRMPELIVGSFPDEEGDVDYAAAVELGFHGLEAVRAHMRRTPTGRETVVREHMRHANTPEQPYLRPALYQERDL